MPSSDYELSRGAIEAGAGFPTQAPAEPTPAERIAALTEANEALLRQAAELRKAVRRLQGELDQSRRRESFLANSLQALRMSAQAAEEPWHEEQRWGGASQDDQPRVTDDVARLIRDLVADSWRQPRWRSY